MQREMNEVVMKETVKQNMRKDGIRKNC
jgi:hypothetical protein